MPGLADVPLFGNLFKSESRTRKKTNLMVFLRPVVVRDMRHSQQLSLDRYDLMSAGLQANQPKPSSLLPINESAQLPPPRVTQPVAPVAPQPAASTSAQ